MNESEDSRLDRLWQALPRYNDVGQIGGKWGPETAPGGVGTPTGNLGLLVSPKTLRIPSSLVELVKTSGGKDVATVVAESGEGDEPLFKS